MQSNILIASSPHRLRIITEQGVFNAIRIPASILYYLTGITFTSTFPGFFERYFDSDEATRIPMLLTSPAALFLAAWGIWTVWRRRALGFGALFVLLGGQCLAALVVLGAPWRTVRYLIEFWGVIGALAAIGFFDLLHNPLAYRMRSFILLLIFMGVFFSFFMLLRYKIVQEGIPPKERFVFSQRFQPIFCPHAPPNGSVTKYPFLVTRSCFPLW